MPNQAELRDRLINYKISKATQQAHMQANHNWFNSCALKLTESDTTRPVDDLLNEAADGEVPIALWQQLWQMGRATFIASTHPDAIYPPHLQGIWTGTWEPAWFGCYTNDENVQMMHWQTVAGNLAPMLKPLRRMIASSQVAWQKNAKELYGCNGVLAPLQQGGSLALFQQAEWLGWTGGAGWLSRHLWDAWLMTHDQSLLNEELLPLLENIIAFYQDFLVEGEDGKLHAMPSVSVENEPQGWAARWTIDATMEIAIIREVIQHAFVATEAAGKEAPASWHDLLAKLPAYRINEAGEFAEWLHPDHEDNHHHRHLSHIYPLFPGDEFAAGNAAYREAVAQAVKARLELGQQSQTGWSLIHLAHIHARLGNGEAAYDCLTRVLRTCTQVNLLTVHDDWRGQGLTLGNGERQRGTLQLDALYGANSAVLECLIQSEANTLSLLPALPKAWANGEAKSLGTRCGIEVDLSWDEGQATAQLTAIRDTSFLLHTGVPTEKNPENIKLSKGQTHRLKFNRI